MADHALESNSLAEVEKVLTAGIRSELQKRFEAATDAKKHAEESVDAGRRYVHAYAEFVHYVDAVARSASGSPSQHKADLHATDR